MEFPHLGDTRFPNLGNVNVFSYQNDFDYTRWTVDTEVTLTNVLWNGDYSNVVLFDTDEKRDKWFDEQQGTYKIKLRENQQMPPDGGIKLPIPYAVAARYNYLFVDIPVMPGTEPSIEYESESGVRRWFFFVDDVDYGAPNTTRFSLSLDVWTQYQNDIDIKYLFLERGHAPVAFSDVDKYLANPMANNDYLLAPDVTPSRASISRTSKMVPFGNGEKLVCIASTCPPSGIASLGSVEHNDSEYTYGPISYSDIDVRHGYQLQVNGFGVGNGDDYSGLLAPSAPINHDGIIANNTYMYAIEAAEMYGNGTFMEDVLSTCPQFLNTVLACLVVDTSMVEVESTLTIAGHTVSVVHGSDMSVDLGQLTTDDFAYPERYRRFAKLYTFPYASLELTDNEGKSIDVHIEDIGGGGIVARKVTQLAFPYVQTRLLFEGIGGVGSDSYTWRNLNGSMTDMEILTSDWFTYCFDNEIPCYALYMDAETAWYLDNFNRVIRNGREGALVAYHNAVRPANTQRANVVDSDATMVANTGRDATTLTTNTNNTENTVRANADLTIATNDNNTANAAINTTGNAFAQNLLASEKTAAMNLATSTTSIAENETTAAAATNTTVPQAIAQAAVAAGTMTAYGATMGSVVPGAGNLAGALGGAAVGAMVGLANLAGNYAGASANATAAIQASEVATGAVISSNNSQTSATRSYNTELASRTNGERNYHNAQNNALLDAHTDNNNANNRRNANNTANTMRANASATQGTNDSNATYTRETSVLNAKETLENSRRPTQYAMYDARNAAPRPIGSYAGDATPDYMRTRGVQVKVRTMPDGEVRQVGDWFARYGYALEQMWDVSESGLCPMEHFCYWKVRDAWVDDRRSSNNAVQQLIVAMLDRGVTIWKNADEVGRVSIYDNMPSKVVA